MRQTVKVRLEADPFRFDFAQRAAQRATRQTVKKWLEADPFRFGFASTSLSGQLSGQLSEQLNGQRLEAEDKK